MKRKLLTIIAATLSLGISAQVVDHVYNPEEVLQATYAGESLNIDFDNDLNPELLVYGTKHDTTFSGFPVTITGFVINTYGNTEIAGSVQTIGAESVLIADSLNHGDVIDLSMNYVNSGTPSVFPGVGLSADASGFYQLGKFTGMGYKYVGVKFDISGSTHFGWIRLSVTSTSETCNIHSYGYETTSLTSIDAGEMSNGYLGVEELSSNVEVQINNNKVKMTSLSGANVKVYNLLGETISSVSPTSDIDYIDASSWPSGVYLVNCKKGSKVITFKIYKS